MNGKILVEKLDFGPDLLKLHAEWDQLLAESVRPTIFMTFDFVYTSCNHFKQGEEIFILRFSDEETGELLAFFPLSLWIRKRHGIRVKVLAHGITPQSSETDKPSPIIKRNMEARCWMRFRDYLKRECKAWDVVELDELLVGSYFPRFANQLFRFPFYWTRVKSGPDSPIIKLAGEWEDFWGQHRKLRKKCGRLERRIENLSYCISQDSTEVEQHLQEYVETEIKSWKEGGMVAFHRDFYADLFPKLAEQGRLWFGVMRDGDTVVSVEIAYSYLDKIYFSHGTYLPDYAEHSPGMVNSCWLIRHFHGKGFVEGDYLAGFADYVNAWSYRIEHTRVVTIHRMGWKNQYLAAWHMLGRLKRRIQKPKDEKVN
ncbi:GNAT family N-acetyltransferase [Pontiellaceae bacterium B1224]|nr:GNAT family N-acetyltransferase [Pontiellaceae bacterium B1224]